MSEPYDLKSQAAMALGSASANEVVWGAWPMLLATVLTVRYPDEPGSRYPNEITYDIVFHVTRQTMENVPRLHLMGGAASGDEVVFTPSSGTFTYATTRTDSLTGDQVLVAFLDGNSAKPVILGAVTHPNNTYKGSTEQGERRFMQHKGTTVEIDKNGNVTASLAPDRTFSLAAASANLTVPVSRTTGDIETDGNVSVGSGASGSFVDLGGQVITVVDGIVVSIL